MTYSATDAYSDLTQALDLTTPAEWDEDGREHVSDETDLALAKIQALKDCREALADALGLCHPTELADAREPENVSRRASWIRKAQRALAAAGANDPGMSVRRMTYDEL